MSTEVAPSSWRRLRGPRKGRFTTVMSITILVVAVIAAIFGSLIAPYDPMAQDLSASLQGPSPQHWLGTDEFGRDVFSRLIVGARTAIVGPLVIAFSSYLLGCFLGIVAGYFGGRVDSLLMRVVDLIFALPGLLVAIVVVGVMGGGYAVAVALLVLLTMPTDTRIVRSATLTQRRLPYVDAAQSLGLGPVRIMSRHILPNIVPLSLPNAFLNFALSIVALSSLSFLGVGVAAGTPDWGRMLAEGVSQLSVLPVLALAPAIAIVLTATAANLVGDIYYERISDKGRQR